jgi:hypothetical protein
MNFIPRCAAFLFFLGIAGMGSAQYFSSEYEQARRWFGLRHYHGYPYHYSVGLRYDPYWSYNAGYFPETYYGDGSYYGIGYSPNYGDGWYGTWYYW